MPFDGKFYSIGTYCYRQSSFNLAIVAQVYPNQNNVDLDQLNLDHLGNEIKCKHAVVNKYALIFITVNVLKYRSLVAFQKDRSEVVRTESSLFAILTSMLLMPALKTNIFI